MVLNNRKHSATLDIVRGVSALLIVLFHYTCHYNRFEGNEAFRIEGPVEISWGYAAVVTFFMMSGYLTAPLLDGLQMKPRQFIWKKLKRFYPAYWIAMTVTAVTLYFLFEDQAVGGWQYVANLTMVSQLFRIPFIDGVYWSMQCELVFCLLMALLLCVRRSRTVNNILLGWIIVVLILNVLPFRWLRFLRIVLISSYAHTFIAGIVLYRLRVGMIGLTYAMLLFAACLLNSVRMNGLMSPDTAFFVLSAVVLYGVEWLDGIIDPKMWIVRVIAWIAVISYPLYLVHEMVGFAIMRNIHALGFRSQFVIVVPVAVSILIAWCITALTTPRKKRKVE